MHFKNYVGRFYRIVYRSKLVQDDRAERGQRYRRETRGFSESYVSHRLAYSYVWIGWAVGSVLYFQRPGRRCPA